MLDWYCKENLSCWIFIVGKNASWLNYTVKRTHLARTMLKSEHILLQFIVWDNTFCYNFTVSDKTSCYSFIVGENTSCWNYTVKRTHLARTILKSEHIFYKFTVSDNTSCYSFIVGENTSCNNYTVYGNTFLK